MMEGLCRRAFGAARFSGRQFVWRSLAVIFILVASLAAGLGFLHMHVLGIPFEGNLHIVGIFALIGALTGIVLAVLLRAMIQRGLVNGLDRMDAVAGAGGQQARKMAYRLEFEALEERLLRALDERRDTFLGQERDRLLAASRYGWSMPDDQLEKILDDETAASLRGKTRECVQVFLFAQGFGRALLSGGGGNEDGARYSALLKKHLSRVQSFARSSGMMLAVFSLDFSVLVSDVPYPGKQSVRKRLPGLARKWLGQCASLLDEARAQGVDPVCLLAFGDASWGRVQSGSRVGFHVEPSIWQSAVACVRENRAAGLWLSAAFCEYAALRRDEVPDLVEQVPGEWYSLG